MPGSIPSLIFKRIDIRHPASKDVIILKFRSVNCLSFIIKASVAEFILLNSKLLLYSSEHVFFWTRHFWRMCLKYENCSLRRILFQTFKQHSHCKSLIAKSFWWNYNKSESCKCYLGMKEQKWMFLVVSQLDVHTDFDFCAPGHIERVEINLSGPVIWAGRIQKAWLT